MVLINTLDVQRRPVLEIPKPIEDVERSDIWFSAYIYSNDWQHLGDYNTLGECVNATVFYHHYKILRCRMVPDGIISEIII